MMSSSDLRTANTVISYTLHHAAVLARKVSTGQPGTRPTDTELAYESLAILYEAMGRLIDGIMLMPEVKAILSSNKSKGAQ
jgi:hypothetical protein